MELYPIEDVEQWYNEWLRTEATHFAARLFDVIAGADPKNLERIRRSFPEFVQVFEQKKR